MIDIQKFGPDFHNGSSFVNVWCKPVFPISLIAVYLCGGGGGGGSGAVGATAQRGCGGGGGAGGALLYFELHPNDVNTYESVVIGAGGTGGAAKTGNSVGAVGTDGGSSVFASTYTARGGPAHPTAAPKGANLAATTFVASGSRPGGNACPGAFHQADGPRVVLETVGVGPLGYLTPGAGGGGGGGASGIGYAGASAVPNNSFLVTVPSDNGGAAITAGGPAVNLFPESIIPCWSGGGGGGGAPDGNISGAGGAGKFGSGGGGSGGKYNFGNGSGAGGAGGSGFCIVVAYG